MKTFTAIILTLFSLGLFAAELDGIKFDDKIKVENKELVLNGIGIRKATIFKVKVYYGGLYLENKSKDPAAFLTTSTPKQIVMNFVHDVDAKKLREGFNEGMDAANKSYDKASMDKFNATIPDVVKGDKIIVTFLNDGVVVNAKGKQSEKISSADFSKQLLNIWFTNPRDEGLKKGLLGL